MNVRTLADHSAVRSGEVKLKVERTFGESCVTSALASSPMKVLTPVARGKSAWAFTSSFGGGLVAGDRTRLDLTVGAEARCFLSTQSSTKVYRSFLARPCSHSTHAVLAPGALLIFAPEPVQAFADSRYAQRQEFRLATGAGLALLDWFTSGRSARGERWAFAELSSRSDVYLDDQRVLVDSVRLSSGTAHRHMGRFNCQGILLLMGPPLKTAAEALLQKIAVHPPDRQGPLAVSASPVPEGVLVRFAGAEVEVVRNALRDYLGFAGELLGDDPWARKW